MATPMTVYVMQMAHTDIGYTHPQEQIMLMYLDFYERVLDLCSQTRSEPEERRFKWTCETSWQVRNFLEHRPERADEFIEFAKSGQIEVTAGYLNFTDLVDSDLIERSLAWVTDLCERHGIPLKTAVMSDINGWGWSTADALSGAGIENHLSQINLDSGTDPLGERGSVTYDWLLNWKAFLREDAPFRIPRAIWWKGPRGGRVLHWRGEHYHLGNFLGISSNFAFEPHKSRRYWEADRLTAEDLYEVVEVELPAYVDRLTKRGYDFDIMLVPTSGYLTDNSAPDGRWCEVIGRWNAEHDDIALRTATATEFFDALRSTGVDGLETHEAAWPDHWAHGLGSLTARVAQARRTQRRRASVSALVRSSGSASAEGHLESAVTNEMFALEHTFDTWATTAWPNTQSGSFQHSAKELYFHRAEMFLDEAANSALRGSSPPGNPNGVLLASLGGGIQVLHFSEPDRALHPNSDSLVANGESFRIQLDTQQPPTYVAAVRGEGPTEFEVAEVSEAALGSGSRPGGAGSADGPAPLETAFWSLEVDPARGGLTSLVDARTGRDWVAESEFGFGELVREVVVHPMGREAVGNVRRLVELGVVGEAAVRLFDASELTRLQRPTYSGSARRATGPVFDSLRLDGDPSEFGTVRMTWRAYHDLPIVELIVDWEKSWSDLPEAAYVTFPFDAGGSELELETAGGLFSPGRHGPGGQVPGTCSSFYTVQRGARIGDATPGDLDLYWLPVDAPLVVTNQASIARWETDPYDWNGLVASMPVNHYWHTNFPVSQRGALRLRYRIYAPTGPESPDDALRLANPVEALGWEPSSNT